MANTAVLIKRNSPDEESQMQSVDALASDATNYWRWSVSGISVGLTNVQVQAYLDAEADNIVAAIIANNEVPLTAGQIAQIRAEIYANQHLAYKTTFWNASYVLESGLFAGVSTLAAYRAVLTNTIVALVPLVGTNFETHFNIERTAQGLPPSLSPATMTLAQCSEFDELLHIWLSARRVDVLIAENL